MRNIDLKKGIQKVADSFLKAQRPETSKMERMQKAAEAARKEGAAIRREKELLRQ